MMNSQRVLQFEYQQSLLYHSEAPGWSEILEVSVRILSAAISSGWYRERFGSRGNDFVVLLAVAMHARPLKGDDLKLLVSLGMAKPEDEGRLYARVTDLGMAQELGMSSKTIQRAAERLRQDGALSILDIPDQVSSFRDSHGRFNGSKVYLLSGDLQGRFLEKRVEDSAQRTNRPTVEGDEIVQRTNCPAVEDAKTVQRTNCPTVETPENALKIEKELETGDHRETLLPNRWTKVPTNLEEEEERGGGIDSPQHSGNDLAEQVFAYFASCKNDPYYQPSAKERAALESLLANGYTLEEILDWVDYAFARLSKPHHFTFVAILARNTRSTPEGRTQPATRTQPDDAPVQEGCDLAIEPVLAIYRSTGRELTPDILARLRLMSERCDSAARKEGSTGEEWLAEAIEAGLGVAQPDKLLNYASAVLGDWTINGKPAGRAKTTPDTPEELAPELVLFQQATGGRLPLPDQRQMVIQAIRERNFTAESLRPFWEAWVGRDKKRTDLDWLLDWAAKGSIPPAYGAAKSNPEFKSLPALQAVAAKYGDSQHE